MMYMKIPKGGVLSIPLMSGYASLHSMLAMGGAKSVVCHCDIRGGYCRWAQATQKPSIAMGKRVLYCTVAYSIECREGKRSNGQSGGTSCLASSRSDTALRSNCGDMYVRIHCRIRSRASDITKDMRVALLSIIRQYRSIGRQ